MVFFMQEILQKMQVSMELKGFAKSTKKTYSAHVKRFAEFCDKPLVECDYDDVRNYLYDAIHNRKLSGMFVDSCYSAITFLFKYVFNWKWDMQEVPRLKRKVFLPEILTREEVFAIINSAPNLKHKAVLATAYSAGLRVSEIAHIKISDIDSSNMRILVRQGKGGKDRYTLLSQNNLLILRQYYKAFKPKTWLFPGAIQDNPVSSRTLQTIFKDASNRVGITKNVSIHTLRHCFATHMLNDGANIVAIKDLLGHSSIETTCKYLHLTHSQVLGVKNPFDVGGVD
jgi:site-specific recombinase XerD